MYLNQEPNPHQRTYGKLKKLYMELFLGSCIKQEMIFTAFYRNIVTR